MDFWTFPNYAAWTVHIYLVHALWGLVGALVRISYRNSPIRLPSRDEDGAIKLNALGAVFVGIIVGILIDNGPMYSTVGSIAAPEIIDAILEISKTGVKGWIRKLGAPDGLGNSD